MKGFINKACHVFATAIVLMTTSLGLSADVIEDYIHRCSSLGEKFDYVGLDSCADRLMRRGTIDKNPRGMGYGYFYKGVAESFLGDNAKAMDNLHQAERLSIELKDDSLQARVLNALGIAEASANLNYWVAQRYFFDALKIADRCGFLRMEASIYANMAKISYLKKDTAGLKYARECYRISKRMGYPHARVQGAMHIAQLAWLRKDTATARRFIEEAEAVADTNYKKLYPLHQLKANILLDSHRLPEAETEARLGVENARLNGYSPSASLLILAQIENIRKNQNESSRLCHEALETIDTNSQEQVNKSEIYDLIADNAMALGRLEECIRYKDLSKEAALAEHRFDINQLSNERALAFEIGQKMETVRQNQEMIRSQRLALIFLAVAVILAIALLVISIRHTRRFKRLYQEIAHQNIERIRQDEELRRLERNESDSVAPTSAEDTSGEETHPETIPPADAETQTPESMSGNTAENARRQKFDELFSRLCHMMENERLYTDSSITRESIAEKLGTNHTYLTKLVKEKANQNLAQFINSYRIKEAVRILSTEKTADYPLKQLCFDLGFSSISCFYDLFKKQVGMSPATYRKSVAAAIEHPVFAPCQC